jgi:ABC-3C protein
VEAYERESWLALLELRLRQSSGNQFQDIFSTIMRFAHGDDFVRVRPHGSLGDKGCDGYLGSTGEVFACYGTVNGKTPVLSSLLEKIQDDAAKAKLHLTEIMKGWTFVHNFIDGVPVDAVLLLKALEKDVLKLPVLLFGLERFAKTVIGLPEARIRELLGPAITEEDISNLDYRELRSVVHDLASDGFSTPADLHFISPVSSMKLEYNAVNTTWQTLLVAGLRNSRNVGRYFDESADPLLGTRVAETVRRRYLELQLQGLEPGEILEDIYGGLLGTVSARPGRQVAALAVMGYMFERCTLLKDAPKVASDDPAV